MSLKKYLSKFLIFFLVSQTIFADDEVYHDLKVLEVIDGDTVRIEANFLPKPLDPTLLLRIYGIDTPEKGRRAQCEKEVKLSKLATGHVKVRVTKSDSIKVILKKWDKFGGRVLGDLLIDGVYLSDELIERGLAKKYDGKKKQSWCDE